MIRCGHTFLSIGYERPEELTREAYNNHLIDLVEERLASDYRNNQLTRESLTNLFNLIEKSSLKVSGQIVIPPGYNLPPGAQVSINGQTFTLESLSMGARVGAYNDVKFYAEKKESISEGMFKALVHNSPSSLHSELLYRYRRGRSDLRGREEAGGGQAEKEEGSLGVGAHGLLVYAGIIRG